MHAHKKEEKSNTQNKTLGRVHRAHIPHYGDPKLSLDLAVIERQVLLLVDY